MSDSGYNCSHFGWQEEPYLAAQMGQVNDDLVPWCRWYITACDPDVCWMDCKAYEPMEEEAGR